MNYVEIFAGKPFLLWFANSLVIALLATAIALPVATAMAYAFARYNTGGAFLRLGVLASQMLPPIILLLPLFGMFLLAGLMQSRTAIVIAHLTFALPFLAFMLVAFFEGDAATAGGGRPGRRGNTLAGFPPDRRPRRCSRHPRRRASRFHTELERVPVRAGALGAGQPDIAGRSGRARNSCRGGDRAAGCGHHPVAPSGVCAPAVPAPTPHQGTVTWRPQVTAVQQSWAELGGSR